MMFLFISKFYQYNVVIFYGWFIVGCATENGTGDYRKQLRHQWLVAKWHLPLSVFAIWHCATDYKLALKHAFVLSLSVHSELDWL